VPGFHGVPAPASPKEVGAIDPKPIRFEVIEEPLMGHENEPMIAASGAVLSAVRRRVHPDDRTQQAGASALLGRGALPAA
jgi:hypothetical protein